MKTRVAPLLILPLFALLPIAAVAADLQSELMAKEKAMWMAWAQKDTETFRKILTADSIETLTNSRLAGRDAIIKKMVAHSCELRYVDFQDVTVHRLSETVAVVWYAAAKEIVCAGEKDSSRLSITSIWQQQNGQWVQAGFHESVLK